MNEFLYSAFKGDSALAQLVLVLLKELWKVMRKEVSLQPGIEWRMVEIDGCIEWK